MQDYRSFNIILIILLMISSEYTSNSNVQPDKIILLKNTSINSIIVLRL